jgi:hypothetical protein
MTFQPIHYKILSQALSFKYNSHDVHLTLIPGDGNCLFRAFSQFLFGHVNAYHLLRGQAVRHIRKNKKFFMSYVLPGTKVGDFTEDDFISYINNMSKDGTFGADPEIKALMEFYDVNVKVQHLYTPVGFNIAKSHGLDFFRAIQLKDSDEIGFQCEDLPTIYLLFSGGTSRETNNHFDVFNPSGRMLPRGWHERKIHTLTDLRINYYNRLESPAQPIVTTPKSKKTRQPKPINLPKEPTPVIRPMEIPESELLTGPGFDLSDTDTNNGDASPVCLPIDEDVQIIESPTKSLKRPSPDTSDDSEAKKSKVSPSPEESTTALNMLKMLNVPVVNKPIDASTVNVDPKKFDRGSVIIRRNRVEDELIANGYNLKLSIDDSLKSPANDNCLDIFEQLYDYWGPARYRIAKSLVGARFHRAGLNFCSRDVTRGARAAMAYFMYCFHNASFECPPLTRSIVTMASESYVDLLRSVRTSKSSEFKVAWFKYVHERMFDEEA